MSLQEPVTIIGGGLAGCEAAATLAARGRGVRLHEMRPERGTAAHSTGDLAELVCSNSLGSTSEGTGKGLLLEELERLGSMIVAAARDHAVPAGASLAVEREGFARQVTATITGLEGVESVRGEVAGVPSQGPVLIATGPLTSDALTASLASLTGHENLAFFDAIAPIITAESIDRERVFAASRWGKGEPDFLNCPFDEAQYDAFIDALLAAETVEFKVFERIRPFEGCMPIEEMASRGRKTLAFGPMRPVGLTDPRTGRRAHAVVQLRREDRHGQLYNLVGFQTKLKYPEQKRIFRMIPGLEQAEFVRLGSVHRNTFLDAPAALSADLSLTSRPDVWCAGQLTGVEGYAESAAVGLMAGLSIDDRLAGRVFEPPPATCMIGALLAYLREADPRHFQPMNSNFGLVPPLEQTIKGRSARQLRRAALRSRALADLDAWIARRADGRPSGSEPPGVRTPIRDAGTQDAGTRDAGTREAGALAPPGRPI